MTSHLPPDLEPGEDPVEELAALVPDPDPDFAAAVRDRIDRRVMAGNLATLLWAGLAAVVTQLLNLTFGLLKRTPRDEAKSEDEHA